MLNLPACSHTSHIPSAIISLINMVNMVIDNRECEALLQNYTSHHKAIDNYNVVLTTHCFSLSSRDVAGFFFVNIIVPLAKQGIGSLNPGNVLAVVYKLEL